MHGLSNRAISHDLQSHSLTADFVISDTLHYVCRLRRPRSIHVALIHSPPATTDQGPEGAQLKY